MNSTHYLIEIIFKDVNLKKIGSLLIDLTSSGKRIINYSLTINSQKIDWIKEDELNKIFEENKNFGLFINLDELSLGYVQLPFCGIAAYKFEDSVDVEINFKLSDLKDGDAKKLATNLMKLSDSISKKFDIENYFCGLEPASYEETRIFTKHKIGPLFTKMN